MIRNVCNDSYHTQFHKILECNWELCKERYGEEEAHEKCIYNPIIRRFMKEYGRVDDQICERTWKIWGEVLKKVIRQARKHSYFWFVYVFTQLRNERIELKSKDAVGFVSGMNKNGGYLRCNW